MIHTNIDTSKKYVKMKKEVYEHLARTFLDKKSQKKPKGRDLRLFIILIGVFCFLIILFLSSFFVRGKEYSKSIFVIQDKSPIEISYDFTAMGDSKVRAVSFNLNSINLQEYNTLSLTIRTKEKSTSEASIKVKIENSLNEKDSQYVTGIKSNWQDYILPLGNFKKISDWSSINSLSFIVEEWNISNKRDGVYIDDVKFVAQKEE